MGKTVSDSKKIPCQVISPAELKLPVKIKITNEYDVSIYTGTKPAILDEKPKGRLISKGPVGKLNPIVSSGMASYFIISKNNKAVYMGKIGTSGCDIAV